MIVPADRILAAVYATGNPDLYPEAPALNGRDRRAALLAERPRKPPRGRVCGCGCLLRGPRERCPNCRAARLEQAAS